MAASCWPWWAAELGPAQPSRAKLWLTPPLSHSQPWKPHYLPRYAPRFAHSLLRELSLPQTGTPSLSQPGVVWTVKRDFEVCSSLLEHDQ